MDPCETFEKLEDTPVVESEINCLSCTIQRQRPNLVGAQPDLDAMHAAQVGLNNLLEVSLADVWRTFVLLEQACLHFPRDLSYAYFVCP